MKSASFRTESLRYYYYTLQSTFSLLFFYILITVLLIINWLYLARMRYNFSYIYVAYQMQFKV